MSDPIDRQAAIDVIIADKIEGKALNIIIALGDGKQAETLNEACDRHAQLLNGLPSAQPEIIYCKECLMHGVCRFEQGLGLDGYCSQAERGTDVK